MKLTPQSRDYQPEPLVKARIYRHIPPLSATLIADLVDAVDGSAPSGPIERRVTLTVARTSRSRGSTNPTRSERVDLDLPEPAGYLRTDAVP